MFIKRYIFHLINQFCKDGLELISTSTNTELCLFNFLNKLEKKIVLYLVSKCKYYSHRVFIRYTGKTQTMERKKKVRKIS